MKLLIAFFLLVIIGCNSQECENISVRGFTHSDSNTLFVYENPNLVSNFNKINPDEEGGWISKIIDVQGEFFKIEIVDLKLNGWIKKGSLSLNTRNYDGQKVFLYEKPYLSSKKVNFLENEQTVKILDVCSGWAYIETYEKGVKKTGWLEPNMQCGNPYTTCP